MIDSWVCDECGSVCSLNVGMNTDAPTECPWGIPGVNWMSSSAYNECRDTAMCDYEDFKRGER